MISFNLSHLYILFQQIISLLDCTSFTLLLCTECNNTDCNSAILSLKVCRPGSFSTRTIHISYSILFEEYFRITTKQHSKVHSNILKFKIFKLTL